jgi:hypothetical protein
LAPLDASSSAPPSCSPSSHWSQPLPRQPRKRAAPATSTLQGENLVAPFTGLTVISNCNQSGDSTVGYHAEGVATGPYPGTFVADGTITIGPQTTPARPPTVDSEGTFMGPILTLAETFTIASGATTISGSKQLTAPITGEQERATCQNLTFFGGITGTGRIIEVEAATLHEATINEPLGTFTDSGRATPVLTLVQITGSCPAGPFCDSNSGNFDQLFTLSDQAVPPCDEDDQGGPGKEGNEKCEPEDD